MSVIGTQTSHGEASKYLEIGEDASHTDLRRTFDFGSDWYKVRIGFMGNCARTATTTFAAFDVAFGLCSGTANPYSSATCANFLGYQFGTATGATNFTPASIGGATGKYYFPTSGTNAHRFVHKHNTTTTFVVTGANAGSNPGFPIMASGATDDDRGICILEITKPLGSAGAVGTNYMMNYTWVNGGQSDFWRGRTPSNTMFWDMMDNRITNLATNNNIGIAFSTCAVTTVAAATIDEPTNGALDGFNIHWNAQSATNAFRVHQVAVKKLM